MSAPWSAQPSADVTQEWFLRVEPPVQGRGREGLGSALNRRYSGDRPTRKIAPHLPFVIPAGIGSIGWIPALGTRGFRRPLSDLSTDLPVRCHGSGRDGRVEDGRGSLGPIANAPFPIPAHRTGRAALPHPALRLASPRGTRRCLQWQAFEA